MLLLDHIPHSPAFHPVQGFLSRHPGTEDVQRNAAIGRVATHDLPRERIAHRVNGLRVTGLYDLVFIRVDTVRAAILVVAAQAPSVRELDVPPNHGPIGLVISHRGDGPQILIPGSDEYL